MRFWFLAWSKVLTKSNGEPVENLNQRHKTDSKAKSADPSKARNEVQPGHFWWPLKFWVKRILYVKSMFFSNRCFLTEHGWLSKKDVHNGNVLLVGIIVQITLLKSWTITEKSSRGWSYHLAFCLFWQTET